MTSRCHIQVKAGHKPVADMPGNGQDGIGALDFFHAHDEPDGPAKGAGGWGKAMPTSATVDRGRKLLENCPLFAALDEQGRRELVSHASPRNFAASEPICHVGEPGSNMMAVVAGTVRISLPVARGREIILADLPSGELFGEIAMLDGKPRSANATAVTKCELLVLDRRDVLPVLEKYPSACLKMMEILCGRIRRSDERMADIAFFDLPARLAKTLLHYPAPAGGPSKLSLSQRELAEMAGGTRENVNRCLRSWQRRGILQLKSGWTIILKPEVLRGLSNDP
jgi:CRP/FNR family transcriptional regulator, cyclic AMP receptor protein